MDDNSPLLKIALSAAVPLWIHRLQGQSWKWVEERSRACSQIIAEKGDVLQFKSKKQGESAAAFNGLAEGLACLSFVPGGVKFAGLHFEAQHPDTKKEEAPKQEQFKCPDCKAEGAVESQYDHARPDGRRCRKAEKRRPP